MAETPVVVGLESSTKVPQNKSPLRSLSLTEGDLLALPSGNSPRGLNPDWDWKVEVPQKFHYDLRQRRSKGFAPLVAP